MVSAERGRLLEGAGSQIGDWLSIWTKASEVAAAIKQPTLTNKKEKRLTELIVFSRSAWGTLSEEQQASIS